MIFKIPGLIRKPQNPRLEVRGLDRDEKGDRDERHLDDEEDADDGRGVFHDRLMAPVLRDPVRLTGRRIDLVPGDRRTPVHNDVLRGHEHRQTLAYGRGDFGLGIGRDRQRVEDGQVLAGDRDDRDALVDRGVEDDEGAGRDLHPALAGGRGCGRQDLGFELALQQAAEDVEGGHGLHGLARIGDHPDGVVAEIHRVDKHRRLAVGRGFEPVRQEREPGTDRVLPDERRLCLDARLAVGTHEEAHPAHDVGIAQHVLEQRHGG